MIRHRHFTSLHTPSINADLLLRSRHHDRILPYLHHCYLPLLSPPLSAPKPQAIRLDPCLHASIHPCLHASPSSSSRHPRHPRHPRYDFSRSMSHFSVFTAAYVIDARLPNVAMSPARHVIPMPCANSAPSVNHPSMIRHRHFTSLHTPSMIRHRHFTSLHTPSMIRHHHFTSLH